MGKDLFKVSRETPQEKALADLAADKLKRFRETWQATQRTADPESVFASLTREVWAGQIEAAQAAGTYTATIGQTTPEEGKLDACKGCGAGLTFTNFGRQATCGWCKREYRR